MPPLITEDLLRSLTSAQSFTRGQEYFRAGTIFNPTRQGQILTGECEGSTAPFYHLRVELDGGGIRTAYCSCPYEMGGYCKHLVAFLLTYLHKPETFTERKNVTDLLAHLDQAALINLIAKMVERTPDLYPWLETALPIPLGAGTVPPSSTSPKPPRVTQVNEQAYRKRVKNILREGTRGGYDYSGYGAINGVVEQLDEVLESAGQFLTAGDPEGALIILRVLLEEAADHYEQFEYDEGELAGFVDSLAMPLAEAVLSLDLTAETRQQITAWVTDALDELSDYDIDLDVALAALEQGWHLPSSEIEARPQKGKMNLATPYEGEDEEEDEEELWDEEEDEEEESDYDEITERELNEARLNVLERQNRVDEFLTLSQAVGEFRRYTLKLLALGRAEEAIRTAKADLTQAGDALAVAQALREANHLSDALTLGEHGLTLYGNKHALGVWLGPLEEAQARPEQAFVAYHAAFTESPTLEIYLNLKRLSGPHWPARQPQIMGILQSSIRTDVLADVYLVEQDWDAAIALANKAGEWNYTLIEKVADAVTPHRPDWVIQVSGKQAEGLIVKTQSKLYPHAARWLAKMKKAYTQAGRASEWQVYFDHLKTTYARRPALQGELRKL
jgi:uncharacterized Zn finger protein